MSNEVEQLPVFDVQVTEEDMREVEDALRSGWLTMGERTERFEREFAESIGTSRGVALSSCTAALHLACMALDIGPGDEVITTPITWPATANPHLLINRRTAPRLVPGLRDEPMFVDQFCGRAIEGSRRNVSACLLPLGLARASATEVTKYL